MHILFPVRHPFEQGQADEFRAVVAAQVTRRAPHADQARQNVDYPGRPYRTGYVDD